jgi:FkbH-like protein
MKQPFGSLDFDGSHASWLLAQSSLLGLEWPRIDYVDASRQVKNLVESGKSVLASVRINLYRNTAVESLLAPAETFLAFAGFDPEWRIGEYDDSLSLINDSEQDSHVAVVIYDRGRSLLMDGEFEEWFESRLRNIATSTNQPTIGFVFSQAFPRRIKTWIYPGNFNRVDEAVTSPFFDPRLEALTGSGLTPFAWNYLARSLCAEFLPSLLQPPKKILVIDIDNTLHEGVLGEEGLDVRVSEDHQRLHDEILEAKERGYLLALLSKNDIRDVHRLLTNHRSYRLREADFVAIDATWDDKSIGLSRILNATRLGQESVIFIDDNPSELLQMVNQWPQVTLVNAAEGPRATLTNLRFAPGYQKLSDDSAAKVRLDDLKANEKRDEVLTNGFVAYISEAKPVLTARFNDAAYVDRLVDLASRSNQFNLTLRRTKSLELLDSNKSFIALSMQDRFSDSGVIGGIFLRTADLHKSLDAFEVFLSCRVLGRGLETPLIFGAIRELMMQRSLENVMLNWELGPRNQPALHWLKSTFPGVEVSSPGSVCLSLNAVKDLAFTPEGVRYEFE